MKIDFLKVTLFTIMLSLLFSINAQNNDFHIYLSFGQSNMEGAAKIESDHMQVNKRFKMMAVVDCPEAGRKKGEWYVANPPLVRCNTGIGVTDFFGRKMVENLPPEIDVGVINVSIGGCKIELFDKENYQEYISTAPDWMKNMLEKYDNNPYAQLIEMAKRAQKDGVIKGILLHQGESNTGDTSWPLKVNGVYRNILKDLNLKADDVPLIVGGVVSEDQHGRCASMNEIISDISKTIPTAHFVSSVGCVADADSIHFNAKGYKQLGDRYAYQMLLILDEIATKQ